MDPNFQSTAEGAAPDASAGPAPDVLGGLSSLGPYQIEGELGRGGMGAVYLARDSRLDRSVALKVVLPKFAGDPVAKGRLVREAKAAAALASDHVVTILDVGEDRGIVYLAMPVLKGRTLDECAPDGHILALAEVVRIGREAAQGLAVAHAAGFIHRDLKPSNLWVEEPGGRVKILDFGLARKEAEASPLTGTNVVLGTPNFMAPEQARGLPLDGRADLFSLGVILYRLTTGCLPFTGPTVAAVLTAVAVDNPPPVRDRRPDTPRRLVTLIERMLEKDRDRRPADAAAVIAELARIEEAFGEDGIDLTTATLVRPAGGPSATTVAAAADPTPGHTTAPLRRPVGRRGLRRTVLIGVALLAISAGCWIGVVGYHVATARSLCRQSESACLAGDYSKAVSLADQALAITPDWAEAYARRARARYFLGDELGTLADCDEALARDADSALALAYRAPVAWHRHDPADGVANAARARVLAPNLAAGQSGSALAKLCAGDVAGAYSDAEQAVRDHPDDPEAYRALALALAAHNTDVPFLELIPDYRPLGWRLSLALAERAANGARSAFDTAVERSQGQPFYRTARASNLVRTAVARMADVFSFDGQNAQVLLAQAQADVADALKAAPDFGPALVVLADLQGQRGRWPDAEATCRKAIAANPRLIAAYLRAADDLSPVQAERYEMLQRATQKTLDENEGRAFVENLIRFEELLKDLQLLISNKMKRDVPIFVNYDTFPDPREAPRRLKDVQIDLSFLKDANDKPLRGLTFQRVFELVTRQVGATFWVTPDHIEIVELEMASTFGRSLPHVTPIHLLAPESFAPREERRLLYEQALNTVLSLNEARAFVENDIRLEDILKDLQLLMSHRMKSAVPIWVNYLTFADPKDAPKRLKDLRIDLSVFKDANDRPLPGITLKRCLEAVAKQMSGDRGKLTQPAVRFRATAEAIELYDGESEMVDDAPDKAVTIVPGILPGALPLAFLVPDVPEAPEDPLLYFVRAKPRPDALRWLNQGIDAIPDSVELYLARGRIHLEQGQYDMAGKDFQKAIDLNPGSAPARRLKVIAEEAKNKPLRPKEAVF